MYPGGGGGGGGGGDNQLYKLYHNLGGANGANAPPPPPPPKCTPGIVCQRVKMESQIARSPARVLYCHGLLKSSEAVHYCLSLILRDFCNRGSTGIEVSYCQSINLALPIDSDHLQMRLLG